MSGNAPLHVLVTADAVGGVWTYALDLAAGLADEGVTITLAHTGPAPNAEQRAQAGAVPGLRLVETGLGLDWLAPDPAALRHAARRIAELAGEAGVHVAHLNAPALAAARFACPTLAVAHSCLGTWWQAVRGGPLPADFAWRDALTTEGLTRADATAAPTLAHAEATMRVHRLARRPAVIHNGRAGPAPGTTPPIAAAFTAGRLWDAGKGIATLDAAAARLDVPFTAAGALTGPQGEMIACAHLRCPGQIDDARLAAHLAARPVFASAARYEPFGLAVLEAGQAGCALVLADIPVFRELWAGAATFVAADDDAGFADAIAALIADPPARDAAGHAAAGRAARHTVAAMARGTAALYRTLIARGRAAA